MISDQRIVILAIDALDPKILDQGFKKDCLPNFKKLKEQGLYSKLKTTMPPQSPVAWASFITGKSPAEHGVYDFITRDATDYSLDLVWPEKVKKILQLTPLQNPIFKKNRLSIRILFMPDTFPPQKINGKMISGMGTPDISEKAGCYTLFTSRRQVLNKRRREVIIYVKEGKTLHSFINGPQYTDFRKMMVDKIPIEIEKNKKGDCLMVTVQNQKILLKEKQVSDWIKLEFKSDSFTNICGIAKFYLKKLMPHLELYLSPINIDPFKPAYPISYPETYSKELAEDYGFFYTQGQPYDPLTWALKENIFDDDLFLFQSNSIFNERIKIYFGELKKVNNGFLIAYFQILDKIQHLFWRFLGDHKSKYQNTIMNYYQKIDEIVGLSLRNLEESDLLIVLSDHGFGPLDWEINLNSWLKDNGYLYLKRDKDVGKEFLADIDWVKTRAYSVGYNSLYINQKGREGSGIVSKSELSLVKEELIRKLLRLKNPFTNKKIVKKVYGREDLGIDRNDLNSPDVFVGFYKGCRSSGASALGAVTKKTLMKRQSKWRGDHIFDRSEVPGVLLANKKIFNHKPVGIEEVLPEAIKTIKIN